MHVCAIGPCAKDEVPLSGVKVFGLPFLHGLLLIEGSIGSYHAPVLMSTTPDRKLLSITTEA